MVASTYRARPNYRVSTRHYKFRGAGNIIYNTRTSPSKHSPFTVYVRLAPIILRCQTRCQIIQINLGELSWDMDRDVTYSLLIAVFISLLLLFTKFAVFRWTYSWITWLSNIIHLRSLPSPPRRWLVGHALEVGMSVIYHTPTPVAGTRMTIHTIATPSYHRTITILGQC